MGWICVTEERLLSAITLSRNKCLKFKGAGLLLFKKKKKKKIHFKICSHMLFKIFNFLNMEHRVDYKMIVWGEQGKSSLLGANHMGCFTCWPDWKWLFPPNQIPMGRALRVCVLRVRGEDTNSISSLQCVLQSIQRRCHGHQYWDLTGEISIARLYKSWVQLTQLV